LGVTEGQTKNSRTTGQCISEDGRFWNWPRLMVENVWFTVQAKCWARLAVVSWSPKRLAISRTASW